MACLPMIQVQTLMQAYVSLDKLDYVEITTVEVDTVEVTASVA